jgi:hypothetical protein
MMCRPLITKVRMSALSRYLPVDHHVFYHKVAGLLIMICSIIHAIAHLINIGNFLVIIYLAYTY